MDYRFPYDFAGTITIPDRNLLGVFQAHPHADRPEEEIIAGAIRSPIGAARLRELIKPGERVLLLPDDVTRATPAHRILPFILEELAAAGIPDEDVRVLVSLGTHRRMTDAELTAKLSSDVMRRFSVDQPPLGRTGEHVPGGRIYLGRADLRQQSRAVGRPHHRHRRDLPARGSGLFGWRQNRGSRHHDRGDVWGHALGDVRHSPAAALRPRRESCARDHRRDGAQGRAGLHRGCHLGRRWPRGGYGRWASGGCASRRLHSWPASTTASTCLARPIS